MRCASSACRPRRYRGNTGDWFLAARPEPGTMPAVPEHPRKRILLADDNQDVRESTRLVLEQAGYEVEAVANGARALEAQRARPADVLITDIFMPEKDGIETIAAFRSEF